MRQLDPATAAAVQRFADALRGKFPVAGAIVFGSRARGTHGAGSDADIAVFLHGHRPKSRMQTVCDMADVAFDVLLDTGIHVSPLPIWFNEFANPEKFANPALLRNIYRDGIRVNNRPACAGSSSTGQAPAR